ncbi:MAG: protein phosphatase 2C domain-containing protein [Longimicrobiales bacterium]
MADVALILGLCVLTSVGFALSAWRRRHRSRREGGADLPSLICPPPARREVSRARIRPAAVPSTPRPIEPRVVQAEWASTSALQQTDGADAETVFFLPGFLEVCGGPESGRRIRFPALRGAGSVEYTLGRQAATDAAHVQIGGAAVSRRHLRLRHEDSGWTVWNLSRTNPAIVEGAEPAGDGFRLQDGATIQAGSLTLRYRGPERGRVSLRAGLASEEGRRSSNQDAVLRATLPDGREVVAVADGMGGHVAGEVASRLALDALERALVGGSELEDATRAANQAVFERAREDATLQGMGTTLVALVLDGATFELANVGDSRAYRVVGRGLEQLTRDHSFVAEAVRAGGLSPEEAETSPWRNVLMRSLGTGPELDPDMFGPYHAEPGERLLLCTDGVHAPLDGLRIASAVQHGRAAAVAAERVCALAIAAGGEDNATAAVVDFEPIPSWHPGGSEFEPTGNLMIRSADALTRQAGVG